MTSARTVRVLLRLLLVAAAAVPVALVVAGSLRPPGALLGGVELLPRQVSGASYERLDDVLPLGRLLRNSLVVVAVAVPVTVLVASWAGFALVQLPPRRRRWLVGLTTALLLVPLPLLWVPRFALYLRLGVLDTLVPLVAPALAATTPFTVLLAYRAFSRLPPSLWEVARLEGASPLTTWWRVGLPLVRPTTTAVAVLAFVLHWGSYLDALLYARSDRSRTLPLGVGELATVDRVDQGVLLAASVVLVVPALLALVVVARPLLAPPPRDAAS